MIKQAFPSGCLSCMKKPVFIFLSISAIFSAVWYAFFRNGARRAKSASRRKGRSSMSRKRFALKRITLLRMSPSLLHCLRPAARVYSILLPLCSVAALFTGSFGLFCILIFQTGFLRLHCCFSRGLPLPPFCTRCPTPLPLSPVDAPWTKPGFSCGRFFRLPLMWSLPRPDTAAGTFRSCWPGYVLTCSGSAFCSG